jgi:membrane associated rhomboid family serine protease
MIPLRDDIPGRGRPRVVRLLLLANLGGYLLQILFAPGFTERFALRPAYLVAWWRGEPLRAVLEQIGGGEIRIREVAGFIPGFLDAALPLLTSQFLHGDPIHLGLNMLFLWIFADNIEGEIGSRAFLAFYLACGVLAGLCHVGFAPDSLLPTVGASGAISGVLGAYFVRFPHARILTLIPIFVVPFLAELPAILFLGVWFAIQLLQGLTGTAGMVAVWAHAGGFVAGLLLVGIFPRVRQRARGPGPRYSIQGRPR